MSEAEQLYLEERRARQEAEKVAQRSSRLQSVTAALSAASTVADACHAVVVQGVSALEAATGGLWLIHDSQRIAELVESVGYRSESVERYGKLSLDGAYPVPVVDSLRTAQSVWLSSRRDLERSYPQVATAVGSLQLAIACLPMVVGDRCIGALAFSFDQPREFTAPEQQFLLVLARHCAQAIERARLYDLEKTARASAEAAQRRTAFLLEASVILSSSLDYRDNFHRLAQLAVSRVTDWCVIELHSEPEGPTEALAVAHVDPSKSEVLRELRRRYPPDPRARHASSNVLRTGQPELYSDLSDEVVAAAARDDEHRRMLREVGVRSLVVVPMVARGRIFGTITMASADPARRYGPGDLELARLLGLRAGIAIDNALLYEAAQAATRAREEVLSVVSHDLKNPLNVILMSAGHLLRVDAEVGSDRRIRRDAETIQRSAERMARLIDDLRDFDAAQSGHLAIVRAAYPPEDITQATVEMFTVLAQERELQLQTRVDSGLPAISCDRDRIIQALGNLVSNAVKVTEAGGTVTVGTERAGTELIWFVEDTGPGVREEDMPRLFQRYWRGERTSYKGTGLGLTIAKGIVEAHGGRIWAESRWQVGSRFCFALPAA